MKDKREGVGLIVWRGRNKEQRCRSEEPKELPRVVLSCFDDDGDNQKRRERCDNLPPVRLAVNLRLKLGAIGRVAREQAKEIDAEAHEAEKQNG